jgi:hypothetical protein
MKVIAKDLLETAMFLLEQGKASDVHQFVQAVWMSEFYAQEIPSKVLEAMAALKMDAALYLIRHGIEIPRDDEGDQ